MSSPVTLVVGKEDNQETFRIHRAVLAHQCEVFEAMFFGPNADNSEIINLPEDDPEAFASLVRYGETCQLQLKSIDDALSAYNLFDKYLMPDAKRQCINRLNRSIDSDTAGRILEIAKELSEDNLSYNCWLHILRNTDSLLTKETFQDLEMETISAIIRQDVLSTGTRIYDTGIQEITVYKALVEWGQKERNRKEETGKKKSLRQILEPLLCHIRFLLMQISDFTTVVCRDGIFTDREQLEILKTMKKNTPVEVSSNLNISREERKKFDFSILCLSCCSNDLSNSKEPVISECFRSNSHNLYICGILIYRDFSTSQPFTVKIRNISSQKEIVLNILEITSGREILDFKSTIFVAKDEVFEITLQSDSEEQKPCCTHKCDITPLLERVSEIPSSVCTNGHFAGIYALPIKA